MKTRNLILTAVFALIISGTSFGKGDHDPNASIQFDAGLQPTQSEIVYFRCINNAYDKLLVKIYDDEGTLIHSKTINTLGNIKLGYSTKELPSGKLTIKVFNKSKNIYSQDFNVTADKDIYFTLD